MIFDSPKLLALCEKYLNKPIYEIPSVVSLANQLMYEGERIYLESLFSELPAQKKKQWLSRFISDERSQFWGAWFELMLYGWLKPLGNVQIETEDSQPDFVLTIDEKSTILIEAKALLTPKNEWLEDQLFSKIVVSLRKIQKPYSVRVIDLRTSEGNEFGKNKFIRNIGDWLTDSPDKEYVWKDKHGNEARFLATYEPSMGHAYGVRWSDIKRDWKMLKNALDYKAKQHRQLREQGYPYVISLFLQSYSFRPRDVITAWLGRPVLRVNRQSGELTHTTDETGLHYFSEQIVHTSLSGTLVFTNRYNEAKTMRELEAYWLENPFVEEKLKIDNSIFPTVDSFIVTERNLEDITLRWSSED